jgi:hypothetical protein
MSQQDEPGLARLSEEILSYLGAHPQAADTVDGIVGWWLPRQRHYEAVDRGQGRSGQIGGEWIAGENNAGERNGVVCRSSAKNPLSIMSLILWVNKDWC